MTVSAQTPYNTAVGNGVTTVFPYQFKILAAGDLDVYVAGALKTLNVDYSVSGVGADVGGSVTFLLAAPAALATVSIIRTMTAQRTTDYQQLGDFLTPVVNPDFDNAILLIQDLQTQLNRSIRAPADEVGQLLTLPSIANRAGKFGGYGVDGQPTVLSGTGNDSALRTDLAAGTANLVQFGAVSYPQNATEATDSVVPTNRQYLHGKVQRYNATLADAGNNWYCYGQAATFASNTAFTVAGNYTSRYYFTSRVRLTDNAGGVFMGRVRNSTFGAGVTRVVVAGDGNLGLLGNVPATITSLCREEVAGIGQSTTMSYSGHGSDQGFLVWNRDTDPTAYAEIQVQVGQGASSLDGSGETIFGGSAGLAIRACPTTRTNSLLSGGTGYGGGGAGGAGAQIVLHTGLSIPIIIGTFDQERMVFTPGTSAILAFGSDEVFRYHSPRVDDLGGCWQTFYEDDRTTRKGYLGFSNGGTNNTMEFTNEKAASNTKITATRHVWLSHGGGAVGNIFIDNAASMGIFTGAGSPNGVITANPGSIYHNSTGGAAVSIYVKEAGTGTNLNWTAK